MRTALSVTLVYCGGTPERIELGFTVKVTTKNGYFVVDADPDLSTERETFHGGGVLDLENSRPSLARQL